MKKYLIVAFLLMVVSSTFAQAQKTQTAAKVDGPVLTLDKNSHEFGTITQGDVVEKIFTFTNTGNQPLIITNITTSCGCTTPEWPRNPIMPGGKGEIKVGFNSAGKSGPQVKKLPILSNAVNDPFVSFTTTVVVKEATPQVNN